MPTVPLVESVYVIVIPARKPSHPEAPESGFDLQLGETETKRQFIPVFTDEDLAERWIKIRRAKGAIPHCLATRQAFVEFLKDAKNAGHRSVGYDPVISSFEVHPIARILRDIERQGS